MNVARPVNYWDGSALRRWRVSKKIRAEDFARALGVSLPTLYRIENSSVPTIHQANKIVYFTRGAIRYRDFYAGFIPEFA